MRLVGLEPTLLSELDFETSRALIGCLDFGLIIAIVIARCRKTYEADVERGIWVMNELK